MCGDEVLTTGLLKKISKQAPLQEWVKVDFWLFDADNAAIMYCAESSD